jgi:hypothetical protein
MSRSWRKAACALALGLVLAAAAWAALRYKDYALLRGPRQLVQQGYVNRHDSRMTPNTFEGVTLSGTVGPLEYYGGFLAKEKPQNRDEFIWMTQQSGIARHNHGLGIASVRVTPWEDLSVYAAEYYLPNGYNTAFGRVSYNKELGEDLDLSLGFQYTDQRSVGAASSRETSSPGTPVGRRSSATRASR